MTMPLQERATGTSIAEPLYARPAGPFCVFGPGRNRCGIGRLVRPPVRLSYLRLRRVGRGQTRFSDISVKGPTISSTWINLVSLPGFLMTLEFLYGF